MAFVVVKDFKNLSVKQALSYCWEYITKKGRKPSSVRYPKSVRQTMRDRSTLPQTQSEQSMLPLRDGR